MSPLGLQRLEESSRVYNDDIFADKKMANISELTKFRVTRAKVSTLAMLDLRSPGSSSTSQIEERRAVPAKKNWKASYAHNMRKLIRKVGRSGNTKTLNAPKDVVNYIEHQKGMLLLQDISV
jgi:hypothetical protein